MNLKINKNIKALNATKIISLTGVFTSTVGVAASVLTEPVDTNGYNNIYTGIYLAALVAYSTIYILASKKTKLINNESELKKEETKKL